MELFFSKLQAYKPVFSLTYFYHSIPERMSAVKLLFAEAGATSSLQNKRFLENSLEGLQLYLERTPPWMCHSEVSRSFCSSYFIKTLMDRCFLKFKQPFSRTPVGASGRVNR